MKYYINNEGSIYTGDRQKDDKELTAEEVLSIKEAGKTYIEKRKSDYPTLSEQLDMIYHDMDGWKKRISEIKERHPKG